MLLQELREQRNEAARLQTKAVEDEHEAKERLREVRALEAAEEPVCKPLQGAELQAVELLRQLSAQICSIKSDLPPELTSLLDSSKDVLEKVKEEASTASPAAPPAKEPAQAMEVDQEHRELAEILLDATDNKEVLVQKRERILHFTRVTKRLKKS